MYTKRKLESMTKTELIDYILKIQFNLLKISVEIDEITCNNYEQIKMEIKH